MERSLAGSEKMSEVPQEWFGAEYETAGSLRFVGMQETAAIELARMSEIKEVRVLDFATSRITVDFNPDRLDLLVKDGVVVKAGFF